MAGIYIPGLKYPSTDGVVELRIWGNGTVEMLDGYHSYLLSGVKAVPVPDHGDLIDRSKIGWFVDDSGLKDFDYAYRSQINSMPTILPADKEVD